MRAVDTNLLVRLLVRLLIAADAPTPVPDDEADAPPPGPMRTRKGGFTAPINDSAFPAGHEYPTLHYSRLIATKMADKRFSQDFVDFVDLKAIKGLKAIKDYKVQPMVFKEIKEHKD